MDGQKKVTVGIAHVEPILAFGRSEIALFLFVAFGPYTQSDFECSNDFATTQQVQLAI
jgi:hypothetical protein